MDASDTPSIPPSRLDHGDAWHEQWRIAHREMAIWNRVPTIHLIDDIVERPGRAALGTMFALIAGTTHLPTGRAAHDGSITWTRPLHDPATMRRTTLRVVLGRDGSTIVTAFLE